MAEGACYVWAETNMGLTLVVGQVDAKEAGQAGAQQAVQANQQAVDRFKRAASACLEARGYSVK